MVLVVICLEWAAFGDGLALGVREKEKCQL